MSSLKAGATLGSLGKLPVATRKGYAFLGWYTAATGGDKVGESTVVTADATFYAHWKAKTYKVKFNVNGGKKLSKAKASKKVVYDAKYGKLPTAKKSGKKFAGWYTKKSGGKKITASTTVKISKTTTYYAHWKRK